MKAYTGSSSSKAVLPPSSSSVTTLTPVPESTNEAIDIKGLSDTQLIKYLQDQEIKKLKGYSSFT